MFTFLLICSDCAGSGVLWEVAGMEDEKAESKEIREVIVFAFCPLAPDSSQQETTRCKQLNFPFFLLFESILRTCAELKLCLKSKKPLLMST
jgi:hypothetical protein